MWRSSLLPTRSTIRHFRFRHSFILTPVFFFALSQVQTIDWTIASLLFIVLAFSIFPASHGFNSFYDRDKESIGGLEHPPQVEPQLLYHSLFLEFLGLFLSYIFFDKTIAMALFIYGLVSKLYSHPLVRLKSMPWVSLIVVAFFQGPLIYWLLKMALGTTYPSSSDYLNACVCFGMILAIYPLTQIYQHDEDRSRGDLTLSRVLGINGTFIFSAICFALSFLLLLVTWPLKTPQTVFYFFHVPIVVLFFLWAKKVHRNTEEANYQNTSFFLATFACCSTVASLTMKILEVYL